MHEEAEGAHRIYLRHPGDAPDGEESEEEGRDEEAEEESREGDAFQNYLSRHQKITDQKVEAAKGPKS